MNKALDNGDALGIEAALGLGQFSWFSGLGGAELLVRATELARSQELSLGEANCIQRLGDIALAEEDAVLAGAKFREALEFFRSVPEPHSIGWALPRLARLESDSEKRALLLAEAVGCWTRIDRSDLVEDLRREFPGEC